MKKNWIGVILILLAFLGINFGAVIGQSYKFEVPKAVVNYYIHEDGTASIEYFYTFKNDLGAPSIEFVDIGMPGNSRYSYSNMSGEINGQPINHIKKSEYVSNGVEFGLESNSIPAGQTGEFYAALWGITGIIFPGEADEEQPYVGTQFQPNYFDSSSVSGKTDMTVTLFLPIGMSTEEPRYYPPEGWPGENEPISGYDEDGRVYYQWHSPDADTSDRYIFGAAFPARLVPEDSVSKPYTSTDDNLGFSINNLVDDFIGVACCGLIALFFGWSIFQGTVGSKKRKMKYLPPKISIEGHGIKRGLTAVEAGILLEQPMDKILTMILFSVAKKGAATVITRDPLDLEIVDPLPEGLRAYEVDFLRAFESKNKSAQRTGLQDLMVRLVKNVTKKMKGFSYKETVEYYKKIIEKAWDYVAEAGTPEVKMQKLEEAIDWTMADRDYEDRSRRVFTGPVFVPMWWGRYDPTFRTSTASAGRTVSSGSKPSGGTVSMPSLPGSDFAASVVNGVQSFSAGVIGNLTSFTSGVTNKTNPIPKSSGRSSGGSFRSGGSCACACACASCACACAGGGR